jgi:hypothetical protein
MFPIRNDKRLKGVFSSTLFYLLHGYLELIICTDRG